ncbi:hypothetical protein A6R68_10380 [Neotoma lepida]|uniref:Cell surface glycoprotein MUC18 n=1 Tax=Neotoma lepida TaxID=56216 RepID=A0A1A6FY79_NEOLE|nr:hypothetical protein A6R68_10380 [Neotoma lepida]
MGLPRLVCVFLLAACCCCRRTTGQDGAAGADKAAWACSSSSSGVPGEEKQPALTPELVEVEVGSTAFLKCGTLHSSGNFSHVDWFLIHKERQIPIFRVRQGLGQKEPGEYEHRLSLQDSGATLALSQVTPHDERMFLCKSKRPRLQDHYFELQVYKAPEEPTIQANAVGIHVDRQELREVATCVGRNGYPIPQVIWYKNGRPLQEEENRVQIQSSQIVESSGLYTLQSVLNAQLVKEDKDAQFYCELSYRLPSGNRMKESKEVTVPVFYPAEKVWVEVEPVGLLKEGDHVKIRCLTDGNPQPDFTINKQNSNTGEMEEVTTDENGILSLEPAQKQHSGLYQCQSLDLETMITLLSDTQELLVNYVSDVRVNPTAPEAQEGDSLTLTCEAESNQDLEFEWLRDKTGQLLGKGPVLPLNNLKREAGGQYLCMASVPNVPGLNRTQLVSVGIFVTLTTLTPDFSQTTGLSISTVSPHTRANSTSTEKKLPPPESKGVVIVAVIVCILVLAVLGATLYFFYKKGKLPCGRSGKQEITMPPTRKSEFVVEVKSDKLPEEMALLQGSNGDKRAPGDQGEKYIDLRH